MSGVYPKNLGAKIQQISNYSNNYVKLNPNNSLTELENTSSGGSISIDLPPNSLIDLSTLSIHMDFSTTPGVDGADGCRSYTLSRYAQSLIRLIRVEIGGSVVSEISDYNLIHQIMADYQFGIEGSSKKLQHNYDPLAVRDNAGDPINPVFNIPTTAPVRVKNCQRHLVWNQFLGFLGGASSTKYIDTGITGNVRITIETSPANHCLIQGADHVLADRHRTGLVAGAGPVIVQAPIYTLSNIFATIKKVQIDDGVYFNALSQSLASGIPFQYHFNSFVNTKSSATNGNITMRMELSSGSVSMAFLTFLSSTGSTIGPLPDIANLSRDGLTGDAELIKNKSAKGYSLDGVLNCFCSNYFKRTGVGIDSINWSINGERSPMFKLTNPIVYDKLMTDMGIHDDTGNGIYYGITSYQSWLENYYVATLRLSHVCDDPSFISGLNSQGIPLTLEAEVSVPAGGAATKIAMMTVMTDNILQVYAGRQINVVK
jgi:hypothetical protein